MNAPVQAAPRHFLGLLDLSTAELRRILDLAAAMKKARVKGAPSITRPLAGKTLAMIFDRPSTRTRVSFDIGMRELGGEHTALLTEAELRVLALLATHLTLAEIAERNYVSRATVKTQAISIYRKLEVTKRAQAVTRAIQLGMIDAAAEPRARDFDLSG